MMIAVHMRDGRTVHVLRKRGHLVELLKRKPSDLEDRRPVSAAVAHSSDSEGGAR